MTLLSSTERKPNSRWQSYGLSTVVKGSQPKRFAKPSAGLQQKKKSTRYRERDLDKRDSFAESLNQLTEENCVYIDEAGIDDTLVYPYG